MDDLALPGIGVAESDPRTGELVTSALPVPGAGRTVAFVLEAAMPNDAVAIAECIHRFCGVEQSVFAAATSALVDYYLDTRADLGEYDWFPVIDPQSIWDRVQFGGEASVVRGDGEQSGHWYAVWENECAWEPEHGLQLVLRDGAAITRVSPYDGHPTHRSAWGPGYEIPDGAIYWSGPSERDGPSEQG